MSSLGAPVSLALFDMHPCDVARALLGKTLVTVMEGTSTGGRIVEVEAYLGADDPGSHAATRGITPRNAIMYGPPGHMYVYLIYGMHHMLNFVCGPEGVAGAVLVRALEPTIGVETMSRRRQGRILRELANGPGRLASALAITLDDNGMRLNEERIFVYDAPAPLPSAVASSGRIGLSAGHDMELRFYIKDNPFVSDGVPGPVTNVRARTRRLEHVSA